MGKISTYADYYMINKNYLKKIIMGLFDVNVPETIEVNYIMQEILFNGWCGVFEYKKKIVASKGTLSGIGMYYRPTMFTHSEPFFADDPTEIYNVSENCTVVYNSKFYRNINENGLERLVHVFASRLADIDLSIDTSIINSRVTLVPVVNDINEAQRTKEIIDKMREGESAVLSFRSSISDKNYDMLPVSARDNIVVMELSDARRNVLSDFYNCIGINNIAVDKKERTNLVEMESNKEQLSIAINEILEPIKRGFDECNRMFDTTEFSIELKRGVFDNENKEVERVSTAD